MDDPCVDTHRKPVYVHLSIYNAPQQNTIQHAYIHICRWLDIKVTALWR